MTAFHHIALYVNDIETSTVFYEQAFGFTEYGRWQHGEKQIVMLSLRSGGYIELHSRHKTTSSDGKLWHISFSPSNIDECYERALMLGAKADRPPFDFVIKSTPNEIPVRIAWLFGPDGERIELFCDRSYQS
ncbi:MAG: VOC family protein [Oscillospiraceae bacterium]